MLNARSENTYAQYNTYLNRWQKFCFQEGISALQPPIAPVLNFLQSCRQEYHLGYSAVNTARSALSMVVSCDGQQLTQNEDLITYMKGVKNESPHLPKYSYVWDANLLLDYLDGLGPAQNLPLKQLTMKLAALLLVSSGQRVQTLDHLSIDHLALQEDSANFIITSKLKHTKTKGTVVTYKAFPQNSNLCPVSHLTKYLEITASLRDSQKLFVSYQKPHKPVGTQTLSRWIRNILSAAGINMQIFGAHSVRASSSAAAKRGGATVDTILQAGSWACENTFSTWYDKPIAKDTPSFQDAVLGNHSN